MQFVVYDKQFLRKIKALVSVPYRQITSVGAEDSSGILTGPAKDESDTRSARTIASVDLGLSQAHDAALD